MMGQPASWLAYTGRHDGTGDSSTLIFLDHPDNLRYPNKWFVRDTPFACASFAFMFDEEYELPPGETLPLRYRIAVADRGGIAVGDRGFGERLAGRLRTRCSGNGVVGCVGASTPACPTHCSYVHPYS